MSFQSCLNSTHRHHKVNRPLRSECRKSDHKRSSSTHTRLWEHSISLQTSYPLLPWTCDIIMPVHSLKKAASPALCCTCSLNLRLNLAIIRIIIDRPRNHQINPLSQFARKRNLRGGSDEQGKRNVWGARISAGSWNSPWFKRKREQNVLHQPRRLRESWS